MSPSPAIGLVAQAQAIEHPLPVRGVVGAWGLEYGEQSVQVNDAQLAQIRAEVMKQMRRGMNRANVTIQGGIEGHLDKIKLHKEEYILSRVSDLFALQTLPDFAIWSPAVEAMARAETELKASQLTDAARDIEAAETSAQAAMKIYLDYHEGTISGAGRAATTLEWTRDIAFAVDGIIATVVTGGAGGIAISTALGASGTAAQQAMEVHLGLRKEIDWRGIGIDAALSVIMAVLGGKIADKVLKTGAAKVLAQRLGAGRVAKIVESVIIGQGLGVVQTTFRQVIANLGGKAGAMSPEQLASALADQLTDPKSLFLAGLNGAFAKEQAAAMEREAIKRQQRNQQKNAPPLKEAAPSVHEELPPAAPIEEVLQSSQAEQQPAMTPEAQANLEQRGIELSSDAIPPVETVLQSSAADAQPAMTPEAQANLEQGGIELSSDAIPPVETVLQSSAADAQPSMTPQAQANLEQRGKKFPNRAVVDPGRRPIGFEPTQQAPGRDVAPGGLTDMEPTTHPRTRARKAGTTRTEQLAGIEEIKASKTARDNFNGDLREAHAKALHLGPGGDVHHAIELQVLDKYPGVYTEAELNALANMRGVPPELLGRKQLHNSEIRSKWDQAYDRLDTELKQRQLEPGHPDYDKTVRQHLTDARNQIDHFLGQFFSERRAAAAAAAKPGTQ